MNGGNTAGDRATEPDGTAETQRPQLKRGQYERSPQDQIKMQGACACALGSALTPMTVKIRAGSVAIKAADLTQRNTDLAIAGRPGPWCRLTEDLIGN